MSVESGSPVVLDTPVENAPEVTNERAESKEEEPEATTEASPTAATALSAAHAVAGEPSPQHSENAGSASEKAASPADQATTALPNPRAWVPLDVDYPKPPYGLESPVIEHLISQWSSDETKVFIACVVVGCAASSMQHNDCDRSPSLVLCMHML